MNLNGIVLVSSVLNFGTISFDPGNDLPYPLFLPSYAATAWITRSSRRPASGGPGEGGGGSTPVCGRTRHAGAVPRRQSRRRRTVHRGGDAGAPDGAFAATHRRDNLRVSMARFGRELLRTERRVVGRYDSRVAGADPTPAAAAPTTTPAMPACKDRSPPPSTSTCAAS